MTKPAGWRALSYMFKITDGPYSLFLVTLPALGWTLGLLLVTTFAPDVEWVLLGAHGTRIGRVGVLAMALEAAFGIIFSSGGMMTDRAIGPLDVGLVRKNDGWFFILSLVNGNDIRRAAMGYRDNGCRKDNHGKQGKNNNCFTFHMGSSLRSFPPESGQEKK